MPSTALLVINVQRNRFEGPRAVHDGIELLARLSELVARARVGGVPVIFVRNCGGPGEPDEPGTSGWELSPALPRLAGEPIVDKRSADAFVGTQLDGLLRARGVRRVIVCSVQSESCIQATCRGVRERGYEATLVADAHSTIEAEGMVQANVIARESTALAGVALLEATAKFI